MPERTKAIPTQVSSTVSREPSNRSSTFRYRFPLCNPLPKHGEQKRQRICNWNRQAEVYGMSRSSGHRSGDVPACPTIKKKRALPERLMTSGTVYDGLWTRSSMACQSDTALFQIQEAFASGTCLLACGRVSMAARRMKGVVSPQHAPTTRNPITYRKRPGSGVEFMIGPRL
jgi:hypothetical protein